MTLEDLRPFCQTERQAEILETRIQHASHLAAAQTLGVNESVVRKAIKRIRNNAALRGYAPEHSMIHTAPDTHVVKGVSTLYADDGSIKQQWVKTDLNKAAQLDAMRIMVDELRTEIPRVNPTPFGGYANADLCAVYPLGDPHIGMGAFKEISGQDWNLSIAQSTFTGVFDRLVHSAPSCAQAVIVNLGDWHHYDNAVKKETIRSGHALDTAGTYSGMVRTGVRIMRYMIAAALEHHENVHVINVIGNHDDSGAMSLTVFLDEMYADEPRVTIDTHEGVFNYYQFGNNIIGCHHGHTAKADKLPLIMACDQPKAWADCENRYWLTGHIHHDSKKDYNGCSVESFRTLAAQDEWAHSAGYRSQSDSKAIVLHKEFGEVERHTINVAQVTQ